MLTLNTTIVFPSPNLWCPYHILGEWQLCSFCRWNEESPEAWRLLHKIPKSRSSHGRANLKDQKSGKTQVYPRAFWPRRGLARHWGLSQTWGLPPDLFIPPSVRKIDLVALNWLILFTETNQLLSWMPFGVNVSNPLFINKAKRMVFLSYWMSREEIRECSALWNTSIDRHIPSHVNLSISFLNKHWSLAPVEFIV